MPTTPDERIHALMGLLSDNLSIFISVHNRIAKRSSGFLSHFRKVPFAKFAVEAREQAERWQAMVADIDTKVRGQIYRELSDREKEVFDAMVQWGEAVAAAAKKLAENQRIFLEASQNQRKTGLSEINELNRQYNDAQERYYRLGGTVQGLYEAL